MPKPTEAKVHNIVVQNTDEIHPCNLPVGALAVITAWPKDKCMVGMLALKIYARYDPWSNRMHSNILNPEAEINDILIIIGEPRRFVEINTYELKDGPVSKGLYRVRVLQSGELIHVTTKHNIS
jgi:hypothetical protein